MATVLTGPLAWELPYAVGVALKRPKKEKGGGLTAVAQVASEAWVRSLARELSYATGAAI